MKTLVGYIESYVAREIAEQEGCTEEEAAIRYIEETYYDSEESEQEMPKYHQYVGSADNGAVDVYYDYGADYYFGVLNNQINENKKNMKKRIRLNESQLRNIIAESVKEVLNLGEPGSFRSGTGKEFDDYTKSIGDSYKWAGKAPSEGNMDLFSVQNGHNTDSMYFQSKKDAIEWIKSHISNEEQAQNLMSALKDYIRIGGGKRINQRNM